MKRPRTIRVTACICARPSEKIFGYFDPFQDFCGVNPIRFAVSALRRIRRDMNIVVLAADNDAARAGKREHGALKVEWFFGDKDDVFRRMYGYLKNRKCDVVIKVNAENSFLHMDLVRKAISNLEKYDGIEFTGFPRGLYPEAFTYSAFMKAYRLADRGRSAQITMIKSKKFNLKEISAEHSWPQANIDLSSTRCREVLEKFHRRHGFLTHSNESALRKAISGLTEVRNWADVYADNPASYGLPRFVEYVTAYRDLFASIMRHAAGPRILEIGAGTGLASIYLSMLGYEAVGIDNSKGILQLCRKLSALYNATARFEEADLRRLPYRKGSFDLIFHNGTLEHFPLRTTLALLRKQLSIAPVVVFCLPTVHFRTHVGGIGDENFMTCKEWRRALGEFRIIESFGMNYQFPESNRRGAYWKRCLSDIDRNQAVEVGFVLSTKGQLSSI